jgi:hypothetical protein
VVLVDHALPKDDRAELLGRARTLHPDARRARLIEWGAWAERETARTILSTMAVGDIKYYVLEPWIAGDELFHRTVAEFVQERSRSEVANLCEVMVTADRHSARARRPHEAGAQRHTQGKAPVGGVAIGPGTRAALADTASTESLGWLELKGKADPLEVFTLIALQGRARGARLHLASGCLTESRRESQSFRFAASGPIVTTAFAHTYLDVLLRTGTWNGSGCFRRGGVDA